MHVDTVLVVDDNTDDVFLLEYALRSAGIINPLQKLESGTDAIAYLQGTGIYADRESYPYPGLLLLDLHLPLQTGFDVLDWLKRHPQPDLKVVVCTGTASPKEIEWAYELGAEQVLEKTPDFCRFLGLLEEIPGVNLVRQDTTLVSNSPAC